MCNPQPRGLRQAPLVPSGFFMLDMANQPSGGDVGGVPPGKVEVSPETPRREGFTTIPTTHKVKKTL